MTPIEQATQAAIAEIERQYDEGKPGPYVDDEGGPRDVIIDGHVDMTLVTRAVLAAIRDHFEDVADAQQGACEAAESEQAAIAVAKTHDIIAQLDALLAEGSDGTPSPS